MSNKDQQRKELRKAREHKRRAQDELEALKAKLQADLAAATAALGDATTTNNAHEASISSLTGSIALLSESVAEVGGQRNSLTACLGNLKSAFSTKAETAAAVITELEKDVDRWRVIAMEGGCPDVEGLSSVDLDIMIDRYKIDGDSPGESLHPETLAMMLAERDRRTKFNNEPFEGKKENNTHD